MCVNRMWPVLSIKKEVGIPFTPNADGDAPFGSKSTVR